MATVPKRPLTAEEEADALRLKAAWSNFKSAHKGATQEWLGRESNLGNQSAVGQYLNGHIPLNHKALLSICGAIQADPAKISPSLAKSIPGGFAQSNVQAVDKLGNRVPLISKVQAGAWCEAQDEFNVGDAEEWLTCPVRHSPKTYALRVQGESMHNPGSKPSFEDGDIIFVDPELSAESRSLVIAKIESSNEVTFKRLLKDGDRCYLEALNPSWPNRIIEIQRDAHVCGVVIARLESFI